MKISLKAARVNADLTQTQAAIAVGVDKSTISSWEKGKTVPSADKLFALCALYKATVDSIFLPCSSTFGRASSETLSKEEPI